MLNSTSLIKSSWIAVEVGRERTERVLMVETYIAVSPLEPNYDPAQYEKVVGCVRNVLARNSEIDRASILSMHRGSGCTALFREPSETLARSAA
jgi:exosome complex RNA-binding protein Rrp4